MCKYLLILQSWLCYALSLIFRRPDAWEEYKRAMMSAVFYSERAATDSIIAEASSWWVLRLSAPGVRGTVLAALRARKERDERLQHLNGVKSSSCPPT